jgi:hypothetical protein
VILTEYLWGIYISPKDSLVQMLDRLSSLKIMLINGQERFKTKVGFNEYLSQIKKKTEAPQIE